MLSTSRRPTGYRRAADSTMSVTFGRPSGSCAVDTTPAGLWTTWYSSCSGRHGGAVDLDLVALVHVARRIGHDAAVHPDAAARHEPLGMPA